MKGRRPVNIVAGSSPVVEIPCAPSWLTRAGKAEWRRVISILCHERKVLTVADLATLANYCVAAALVAEASRIIATEGLTFATKNGPRKHPAVAIRSDAMTQARLLAGELGLTPTSRSRPSIRDDDTEAGTSVMDI